MGGKSGAKAQVAEYRLSVHYGVCHGPVWLRQLHFGERPKFNGTLDGPHALEFFDPNLFGGKLKEGGIAGMAYFLPGKPTQTMPAELAEKLGMTASLCPAYRGMTSIFLVGGPIQPSVNYVGIGATGIGTEYAPSNVRNTTAPTPATVGSPGTRNVQAFYTSGLSSYEGFMWSMNNPYIKPLWVTVTDPPFVAALDDEKALIGDDANPAHIIYECLTDTDWGMGAPASSINTTSFQAAATTLYDEGFGLSLGWFQQETIEKFLAEILDHIQATVFVNPRNGLFEIKLLRDDYDEGSLPVFDESNSTLSDFQRKLLGETTNEIVVTYTNPVTEKEVTVSQQDLGNITAQGEVVSDSRDYYGIRSADLAAQVAARDLRTASAPLATGILETDRRAWDVVPGDVIKLSNARFNLVEVVFRVTSVNYGKTTDSKIRLNIIEDIFSFDLGNYTIPPETVLEEGTAPTPMDAQHAFTMPWFFAKKFADEEFEDGDVFTAFLATDSASDTLGYELNIEVTSAGGADEFTTVGDRNLNGRSLLLADLGNESTSFVTFSLDIDGVAPHLEGWVLIGEDGDADQELAFISDVDSDLEWTLERGMLDTVPKAWEAGTPIWFLSDVTIFGDGTPYVQGSELVYKALTRTSQGLLDEGSASEVEVTLDARPDRPLRPAKVRANGEGFSTQDTPIDATEAEEVVITWKDRNRDMEETTVYFWEDDTVTKPVGQTTIVRVYDATDNLLHEETGITDETYTLNTYDIVDQSLIRVNVKSSLGGVESLQGFDLYIKVGFGGWHLSWGLSWSGNS